MAIQRDKISECWTCVHKREIAGNCHISCDNPDPEMTGEIHGIINGWFLYPLVFDPVWKKKDCSNFLAIKD